MLKCFAGLALPIVLSNFSGILMLAINSVFAGRQDFNALAAVGLGNTCSFFFITSIVTGLNAG